MNIASEASVLSVAEQWVATSASASPQWYAVHTRAQHEKAVAARLQGIGFAAYLPLVEEVHQWSDRRKLVQMPLFSCYVFSQMILTPETWARVTQINGVLQFVGNGWAGTPIPEHQIEGVRTLLSTKLPYAVHPLVKIGQRVRVRGGALDGIEGILTACNGNRTLVISVEPVQRSLFVCIDGYSVEPA